MGAFASSEDSLSESEEEEKKGDFKKQYSLGKLLGKGSQGSVYVCYDRQTGESRAVKIIGRENKAAWATYKREVELSQATRGRNIASIIEDFVDRDKCYVLMERFEGHLRKAMKMLVTKGRGDEVIGLDAFTLANVIRQALSAVLHLHTCGVVHRDVKANNLLTDRIDLRDPRCRIVLTDFGLARRLEPGRFLCSQVGTRKYWGPELYEKKYWHLADVFAVGVLMYLAAYTVYPYQDEYQTCHLEVFTGTGAVPPGYQADALDFMQKALVKDPRERVSAAELGQHPWLTSMGGIIQQVDEESMKAAKVARGPCAISATRRFGPKASLTQLEPSRPHRGGSAQGD